MASDSHLLWLTLVVAGTGANEIWRLAGVVLSRGVDPQSPVVLWVRDVSTALVAALVARMLIAPAGALAGIGGPVRFVAFASATLVYFASGRRLALALACGEAVFLAAQFVSAGG
jgi:hypothetical protein